MNVTVKLTVNGQKKIITTENSEGHGDLIWLGVSRCFSNTFWIKTIRSLSKRVSSGSACFAPATLSPCVAVLIVYCWLFIEVVSPLARGLLAPT